MSQSAPSVPNAPDPAKTYEKEIGIYLQNNPQLLQSEQDARSLYDPQRIAEQQGLQAQFGPTQYSQQQDALNQLDPFGVAIRAQLGSGVSQGLASPENQGLYSQLGSRVSSDLSQGATLPSDLSQQLATQIRGQDISRGGQGLGNAPIQAEELFKGQNAINLENSRISNASNYLNLASPTQKSFDNAGQFLGLSTPEQQAQAIAPVSPDRSSAYVNPNAGFLGQQLGLSNYSNQLGAYNAQVAQGNPWARALSGAAQGAVAGGGGWGSLVLGAGGAAAGYFSSRRVKENIVELGRSASGLPMVAFNYIWDKTRRFVGTIAEEVLLLNPCAVSLQKGILCVRYDLIDVPFFELTEVV